MAALTNVQPNVATMLAEAAILIQKISQNSLYHTTGGLTNKLLPILRSLAKLGEYQQLVEPIASYPMEPFTRDSCLFTIAETLVPIKKFDEARKIMEKIDPDSDLHTMLARTLAHYQTDNKSET